MRRNYDKILVTIYNPRVEVSLSEDRVLKSKSMYCSMLNVSTCVTAMFPCLLAIESDLRLNILRGLIVKMLELLRDTRGRAWAVSYFPGRAGPAGAVPVHQAHPAPPHYQARIRPTQSPLSAPASHIGSKLRGSKHSP